MKQFKYVLLVLLVFFALFIVYKSVQNKKENAESTLVSIGQKAPNFTVEMLDGRKIQLSDLKGKVVLLNFWATWCPPCMNEFKNLPTEIIQKFANEKDFVLLPISREEKREVVAKKMEALKQVGIDFPVGIDPNREIYSLYAKQQIPRNFIINKNGTITYISIGYKPEKLKKIAQKIEQLLE